MNELATGRFLALSDNIRIFGPPGVGKAHHVAIALLTDVAGPSPTASSVKGSPSLAKPKLLIVDELGYLRSRGVAPTWSSSSWHADRNAGAS